MFDGGSVLNYLKTVKTWLDAHPNEVLTFIFTNPEGLSLPNVWKPVFESSGQYYLNWRNSRTSDILPGIAPLAYIPPSQPVARTAWPTLGSLIDSGKRVVIFFDNVAGGGVNYIMPQFDMVGFPILRVLPIDHLHQIWEPPFSETDNKFPCRVDRISGPLSPAQHMYMLNHNLNIELFADILIPDFGSARTTNGVNSYVLFVSSRGTDSNTENSNSIIANANGCAPLSDNNKPNFVMLDFVNVGEGMKAVDQLNGF